MRRFIFIALIILSSAGCSTVPFQKTNYIPLSSIDPQLVLKEFASSLPDRFQVLNTIAFQYKRQNFSALGYIDVNRELKTFAVSCLNPMGVTLFELSGDKDLVRTKFVLKELLSKGDLPRVVGEDIRRIYFDNVPSSEAKAQKEKYKVVFSEPSGSGVMKHIFAGKGNMLIEKRYYEKNCLLWSVFYYEYRRDHDKFFTGGIMLK
ncbi:MAG: hypothetical protein HQ547_06340, partial [Candidatus Omnitrophica bacterium]|nr:hypothetical protein [Candidatus Omnitrophota bacterium]